MLTIDCSDFWKQCGQLNAAIDELQLKQAWYLAVHDAANELSGATLHQLGNTFRNKSCQGE